MLALQEARIVLHLDTAKSTFRRLRRLPALFAEMSDLSVAKVAKMPGVAWVPAAPYVETLCTEGVVKKVRPTDSVRSHDDVRHTERSL